MTSSPRITKLEVLAIASALAFAILSASGLAALTNSASPASICTTTAAIPILYS